MQEQPKIPRGGVDKYLKRGYSTLVKRYRKLFQVMVETGVAYDRHFYAGLESATDKAIKQLCEGACEFWGRIVVESAVDTHTIYGWRLLRDITSEVENKSQ